MNRLWILMADVVLLAGCTGTAAQVSAVVCPPVIVYTPAQEKEAASELSALPAASVLSQMITDYGTERAQLRACAGQNPISYPH